MFTRRNVARRRARSPATIKIAKSISYKNIFLLRTCKTRKLWTQDVTLTRWRQPSETKNFVSSKFARELESKERKKARRQRARMRAGEDRKGLRLDIYSQAQPTTTSARNGNFVRLQRLVLKHQRLANGRQISTRGMINVAGTFGNNLKPGGGSEGFRSTKTS